MAQNGDEYSLVKHVYDTYRTARLNQTYYGCRLEQTRHFATAMDVLIAVGTSGAIAGLTIWKNEFGVAPLHWLAAIAVLLSVAKPFIKINERLERLSKLWAGHVLLDNSLRRVVADIQINHRLSSETKRVFDTAINSLDNLTVGDDPQPSKRLRRWAEAETKREIPVASLWWPERT